MEELKFSKDPNGDFVLFSKMILPRTLQEVFSFFEKAQNLQLLTPQFLDFKILTPLPIEMEKGALIDYRIGLYGLPMRWRTEITEWNPPYEFEDLQLKGPYLLWRHRHSFKETPAGVEVVDKVNYRVLGGELIHRLFVKPNLVKIFTYRQEKMKELFK